MSRTVKAQREANETNLTMTRETNQANKDIAESANQWNWANMQAQNEWNLQQWERENEYNSPVNQMQRYLEAGINPLWAMQSGDPGKAQHLESAGVAPANVASLTAPQVSPEYDPTALSSFVAASQNVVNSLQGFYKLGLESLDVDTRRKSVDSQIALNRAEGLLKKSQTAGQDFLNNLNLQTADSLIGIKQRELEQLEQNISNAKKQGDLTDEMISNAKEQRNQLIAMTDYTKKQADALLEQTKQGWQRLVIDARNAETQSFAAHSASYYAGENLKLQGRQFEFAKAKTEQELNNMSNSQILEWYKSQRGWLDQVTGSLGSAIIGSFPGTDTRHVNALFENMIKAGDVLQQRYKDNPSAENYKSYMEWQSSISSTPIAPEGNVSPSANTSSVSIINPSAPWQQ